jgi:hypothetical protein
MEYFKDQKKKSEITEDQLKDLEKKLQDLTDKTLQGNRRPDGKEGSGADVGLAVLPGRIGK